MKAEPVKVDSGKWLTFWLAGELFGVRVEDVQEAASEEDIDCSTERAREILADISHHHDVEYGVNWQTIRDALYESVRREAEAMKR